MSTINNLKISKKLMLSYILISIITATMGIYAIYNIKAIDKSDTELYQKMTVPLSQMGQISTEFQRTRVNARDIITANTPEDINYYIERINERKNNIASLISEFEKTIISDEMRAKFDSFKKAYETYCMELDKIVSASSQNLDYEAQIMLAEDGEFGVASRALQDIISEISVVKTEDAKSKADANTVAANRTTAIMIAVMIAVVVLSISLGLFIASTITKPLKKTVNMIAEMSKGHFGDRLNLKTKDEIGQMADSMDSFADELQNKVIKSMDMIANGDVDFNLTAYDEKDEITPALKRTLITVQTINTEVQKLVESTLMGNLSVRSEVSGCNGAWKQMIQGINSLVDAFVGPINVTANYVKRISKGDIPEKITDEYNGDFNEIKVNLNNCIDIMNGLLSETGTLISCAREGKLDCNADISKFQGSWMELVSGINSLLEAIVLPIKEVTAVMNEISKGNLNVSVDGNYKGEFEILANSVNLTSDDLNKVVSEIAEVIAQICEGNLSLQKVKDFRGDFITISSSLNKILDSLNHVFGEINEASDQVSIGSRQVSSGSQSLSQGTTEQASSVEELTASLGEVSANTRENAESATKANELTLNVKSNAVQGNEHMQKMLEAMSEINESSNNISRIIKVIDDIAFQTNILALNAAVEAARAGEHGKGFAVVAEEVRNLAARSAEAAKETTALIQGSINKVTSGTDIANSTAKALIEIVDGISNTAEIIAGIAKSSNEQAMGISQINTGLNQVSQVVQTNAATAEESAASSEELSSQAAFLKEMVGQFRLRSNSLLGVKEIPKITTSGEKPKLNTIILDEEGYEKY